jgi:hypothetical protein
MRFAAANTCQNLEIAAGIAVGGGRHPATLRDWLWTGYVSPGAAGIHACAGLLKVLVWEDRNGAVSVSYNSPGFLAGRHERQLLDRTMAQSYVT